LTLPPEGRPRLEDKAEVLAPVARDHHLAARRHDLGDVGSEVLDLLERVVLFADDLLVPGLDPSKLLLEALGRTGVPRSAAMKITGHKT
jgi:hypothetical protein